MFLHSGNTSAKAILDNHLELTILLDSKMSHNQYLFLQMNGENGKVKKKGSLRNPNWVGVY